MPRPKTKNELLELSSKNYSKLMEFVDSLGEIQQDEEFPLKYLNRNIRDVLAHLHHWHLMFANWYKVGMKGDKPDIPAQGYTWKTLPDLNKEIREQYQNLSLKKTKLLLDTSFKSTRKLISKHSEEELFTKKKYKWTGTTSLGAYLISVTSSHYDWALKLITKCLKENAKNKH